MDRGELEELARAVLRFADAGLSSRAVPDVLAWQREGGPGIAVAFVVRPSRWASLVNDGESSLPFTGQQAARWVQQAGGNPEVLRYEGRLDTYDFLDRLPTAFEVDDDCYFTVIPEGGWPWPAKRDEYFSARKGKWLPSKPPPHLVTVDDPNGERVPGSPSQSYGLDLCQFLGTEPVDRYGSVWLHAGNVQALVTHCTAGPTRTRKNASVADWAELGKQIASCGGLLMPSLAVAEVPAANYGPLVLVADIAVVTQSISPGKRRGQSPHVTLYDTDTWTATTSELQKLGSRMAFEQYHGHERYLETLTRHLWERGVPMSRLDMGSEEAKVLKTEAQLATALKRRARLFKASSNVRAVTEKLGMAKERYPYLEAKFLGVMDFRWFPFAVAPASLLEHAKAMLAETTFQGHLLGIDVAAADLEAWDDDVSWRYAWAVRDALLAW